MKKKIIFMGTPDFSVPSLEKLHENKGIEISLVVTQEDKRRSRNKLQPTPVKKRALELGIESYEPKNVNSKESLEKIDSINPDFIVVIAYGQLIGDYLLDKYKDRIINIHSSLLPKYRGAAPMHYALLNGDNKTGVCSMLIEKSMDTGDILACEELEITEDMDIEILHDKLMLMSAPLIEFTIINYDKLYKKRVKQDNSKASYTKKITKDMGHINFEKEARQIKNQMAAFSFWPKSYVFYKGKNVKVHKIDIIDKYNDTKEGIIHKVDETGIYVNCKDKCIVIKEIQFPNKKSMPVSEYIKGNTIEENVKLK